jgi:hypothetical protein
LSNLRNVADGINGERAVPNGHPEDSLQDESRILPRGRTKFGILQILEKAV